MTSKQTWKNLEKNTALKLGGVHVGSTGLETVDVEHPLFEIECKYRASLAFIPWFQQAEKHCKKSGKIPLLICKKKAMLGEFVILRLEDFKKLINL